MSLFGSSRRQTINEKLKDIGTAEGKLRVTGCERLVRKLRSTHKEITGLQEQHNQAKEELLEKVKARRLEAEQEGAFYKTCTVSGGIEQGVPQDDIMVCFTDSFRDVPAEHEKLMQDAFGKQYNQFFAKQAAVKTTKVSKTAREIQEAVGDRAFRALQDMGFEFKDVIKTKAGLMEARARLRSDLTRTVNDRLDVVQANLQKAPQVRDL